MSVSPFSPYADTDITTTGYLDLLKIRPIPAEADDVLYTIITAYTYRPDLLAYDLYNSKDLWWVFAQRNLDTLKDPVFDFVAGTRIYLPKKKNLQQFLGI